LLIDNGDSSTEEKYNTLVNKLLDEGVVTEVDTVHDTISLDFSEHDYKACRKIKDDLNLKISKLECELHCISKRYNVLLQGLTDLYNAYAKR
jgi:hypothetical protein